MTGLDDQIFLGLEVAVKGSVRQLRLLHMLTTPIPSIPRSLDSRPAVSRITTILTTDRKISNKTFAPLIAHRGIPNISAFELLLSLFQTVPRFVSSSVILIVKSSDVLANISSASIPVALQILINTLRALG
jgi:hypothetical protein